MFKHVPVLVTFLCVALLYQATHIDANSKEEVKKAFDSLMKAIDKALTQAQNALNKAVNQVNSKATELEGKAKVELDKALAPFRAKLDALVAKAKAKGFDLQKCQNYIDQFTNLPDTLVNELISCITEQVSKAQGYVNDALNNCKKIEQDMANIDKDIDDCGGNAWKKAKCYAKLLKEIVEDTGTAPQHIIEDVTKATALISEILPILEQCFSDKLKKVAVEAPKIIAEFGVCAAV